jgi:hypothetical protein
MDVWMYCTGDTERAREMVLSILQHISGGIQLANWMHYAVKWIHNHVAGIHEFPTFSHHKRCGHAVLAGPDLKPYIKPGEGR